MVLLCNHHLAGSTSWRHICRSNRELQNVPSVPSFVMRKRPVCPWFPGKKQRENRPQRPRFKLRTWGTLRVVLSGEGPRACSLDRGSLIDSGLVIPGHPPLDNSNPGTLARFPGTTWRDFKKHPWGYVSASLQITAGVVCIATGCKTLGPQLIAGGFSTIAAGAYDVDQYDRTVHPDQ